MLLTQYPNIGLLWKLLGQARYMQSKDALTALKKATELLPNDPDAYNNLAIVLTDLEQYDQAIQNCRRALKINPQDARAHNNLGNALRALGKLDEAEKSFLNALKINPNHFKAYNNLGNVLQDLGRIEDAITCYRTALKIKPDYVIAQSSLLFLLNFVPTNSPEYLLEQARNYDRIVFCPTHPHSNDRNPERRLKIGYVSPDFRSHAVATFAEPILANHDKSQYEIFCYSQVKNEDAVTARFRQFSDHWHSTWGLNDEAMANLIRNHQIDILVDLAGHTTGNRLPVFARKPAPIQITYLGYPGTTGLSGINYRITDQHADPEGIADAYYTERLLRLPDSLCCYRPNANMPATSSLPALTHGYLTFGSFNNANKIDPATIALWSSLLHALPSSRLMILTVPEGNARVHLTKQFSALGIKAERLEFHGKLPADQFYQKFLEVDIALDTASVSGGTTTCESLWMGVPVIALASERFITRVSYSFLKTVGLVDFATTSTKDYVRIAVALANDLPRLAEIRAGLRDAMRTSPLTDEINFTKKLERCYRNIWTKWCKAI